MSTPHFQDCFQNTKSNFYDHLISKEGVRNITEFVRSGDEMGNKQIHLCMNIVKEIGDFFVSHNKKYSDPNMLYRWY